MVNGLIFFLFFGCFILGLDVARRTGFLTPVSIYIWFMNANLALFLLVFFTRLDKTNFIFTAMPLPPFDSVLLRAVLIYSLLIFAGWISALKLRKPKLLMGVKRQTIRSLRGISKNVNFLLWAFLILVFWMEIFHFWEINKSILWDNQIYLTINTPASAGIHTVIGRLIHFLLLPLGLLLVGAGTFTWIRRRKRMGAVFLVLSVYPFLLAFAENSRWAPLYVAAILALTALFGDIKRNIFPAIIGGTLGFLIFLKVLVGRNTPYQGLSGTGEIFRIIFSNVQVERWIVGFFLNVFQGTQDLANALLIKPQFPQIYKILSFAPTFSFMDNFDKLLGLYVVKISPVVPMNAYSEAYFFGAGYFLFLLIILIAWLRTMTKISLRKDMLGTAFTAFSYCIIVFISQYPVRNSMRLIYISLLIGMIANKVFSLEARRRRNPETVGRLSGEYSAGRYH